MRSTGRRLVLDRSDPGAPQDFRRALEGGRDDVYRAEEATLDREVADMREPAKSWISTRSERGVVVVSIHGDLTAGSPNKEALLGELSRLLNIGLRRFTLNLEPVSTMDADGINEIIDAHELVTDRDGELTFRGAVTVPLHGHLTIGVDTKTTVESQLSGLLDIGIRSFVLDLGHVSELDSSGIGDLVGLYTKVADRGGQLDLINLPRRLQDILEITQVSKIFDSRNGPRIT